MGARAGRLARSGIRNSMYTRNDPKWVQANTVEYAAPGYVHVTAYGERFENCPKQWNDEFRDKSKSDVLVQDSQGDWLRIWFYDADVIKPR